MLSHRASLPLVIWPKAPKLDGITMLVLRRQFTAAGVPQAEKPVRVQHLGDEI
jgi:hypothetical protein